VRDYANEPLSGPKFTTSSIPRARTTVDRTEGGKAGRGGELLSRKSERNACTRGSTWQPELGPGAILPLIQESFFWRMCAHTFVRSCWDAFLPSLSPFSSADICAAMISNKVRTQRFQLDKQSRSRKVQRLVVKDELSVRKNNFPRGKREKKFSSRINNANNIRKIYHIWRYLK